MNIYCAEFDAWFKQYNEKHQGTSKIYESILNEAWSAGYVAGMMIDSPRPGGTTIDQFYPYMGYRTRL